MSEPCKKCGSTKTWKDGRCAPCAVANKKEARSKESTRKPGTLKPGWAKKGLTKKAADAALPKPKKINDMKKQKVWECINCGNRTDRWKDGTCRPCANKRKRDKYAKLKIEDPEKYQYYLDTTKERADQKRQEEADIQNVIEQHNALNRKSYNKRKHRLQQATPSWLSPSQIVEIEALYFTARQLKRKTGQKYHVDHIVPLKHPMVCGLHVPWNLRVITDEENNIKKNAPYRDPNEFT